MAQSETRSFADDPALAAPIGLAVVVAADLERIHNEIFGGPLRALLRALRVRQNPDYRALISKAAFNWAAIQMLTLDVDKLAPTWKSQSSVFAETRECLRALEAVSDRLLKLLRNYATTERLTRTEAATTMAEYRRAWAYIDARRDHIGALWSPCRAREALIDDYLTKIAQSRKFDDLTLQQTIPEVLGFR